MNSRNKSDCFIGTVAVVVQADNEMEAVDKINELLEGAQSHGFIALDGGTRRAFPRRVNRRDAADYLGLEADAEAADEVNATHAESIRAEAEAIFDELVAKSWAGPVDECAEERVAAAEYRMEDR